MQSSAAFFESQCRPTPYCGLVCLPEHLVVPNRFTTQHSPTRVATLNRQMRQRFISTLRHRQR